MHPEVRSYPDAMRERDGMESGWIETSKVADDRAVKLATAGAALAALMPIAVLLGWLVDSPVLRGLGDPGSAIHPATALTFLSLASGSLLFLRGHPRVARWLYGIALAAIALLVVQHLVGLLTLVIDNLLGTDGMQWLHGRRVTPLGPLTVLVLLTAALFAQASSPRWHQLASPLASTALAALLLVLAFTLNDAQANVRFVGVSTTAGLPVFILALVTVLSAGSPVAGRRFATSPWRILERMEPLIIVGAIFPSLALVSLRPVLGMTDAEFHFVMAMGNLLVVAMLLIFVTYRANEQNRVLAEREAGLDSILQTAPDALIVTDEALNIRTYSRSARLLWDCEDHELQGQSLAALFSRPLDAVADAPGASAALAQFTTGLRSDGTTFPAELRLGLAEQDGERVRIAFVRDLSERMAMEDQLNGLSFQLMHLSRQNAMGELAGDIAHEINQPLTAATNYASTAAYLLEQRDGDAKVREYLSEISAQLLRAGGIIRRLRAFLANREIELRREPLTDVVQDAVKLVKVGSRRVAGTLVVTLPPDLPPVYVDRIQVQQVLVNLLRNAFESCEQAGREPAVRIAARAQSDHLVEIEVVDNGIGLPIDFADRLGQRFSSTKPETGLGIGLNISKRIVEAHGGTLTAGDNPDVGATFRFTIPAAAGQSDSPLF
ncbi:ATP-binding protein [Sphingomonas sp. ST-64]|uniref:histidine kinase n=1 Tax=Sphingomonas plantiphila TaxID=3163295 RepID=A0ABW8YP68_9SPHN